MVTTLDDLDRRIMEELAKEGRRRRKQLELEKKKEQRKKSAQDQPEEEDKEPPPGIFSTRQLADRLGADRNLVYRRTHKLAERGRLKPVPRRSARTLYFVPATRDVITNTNSPWIVPLVKELKALVRDADLQNREKLTKTDKAKLGKLYEETFARYEAAHPEAVGGLDAFKRQLFKVLRGTSDQDLLAVSDIRPFHGRELAYEFPGGDPFDPGRRGG